MNPRASLGRTMLQAQTTYHDVRQSRFVRDKISLWLTVASLVICGLTFISLASSVRPAIQGAVRYSSLYAGYTLGSWYYPYLVAGAVTGIVLVNTAIAYRSFGSSRMASFFLLTGSLVVALFGLIIASALGAVR